MRWSRACLESIAYLLPVERVRSAALEERLAPAYEALGLAPGQLEALTGVAERRYWPTDAAIHEVAAEVGARALQRAGLAPSDLGAVLYAGGARDRIEPATALAVADALGASVETWAHDLFAGCLGALVGMVDVANRIELGQIRAGLVVAVESGRAIAEATIEVLDAQPSMEALRLGLAALARGSAAVAILLVDAALCRTGRRLLGGVSLAAPEHQHLGTWGEGRGGSALRLHADGSALRVEGAHLGVRTYERFLAHLGWHPDDVARVVWHQADAGSRSFLLEALRIPPAKDVSHLDHLGDTGAAAIPLSLAMAAERGGLAEGDRVTLLGIGSGLSSMALGLTW